MSLASDYRACRTLARAEDRDRYLSALFAPGKKRKHLFALYAWNAEIARIPRQVREPMMGELRLQWWRDAIEGRAAGDVSRNPIAHALVDTIKRCKLSPALLHELIDARAFDFYGEPMESLSRLETYLDSTAVTLVRLAAEILNGVEDAATLHAATVTARAFALIGLMRNYGPNAARGKLFVPPLDLLARHQADFEEAFSGMASPALRAALREMRDLARFYWMEAGKSVPAAPKALAAFLPAALVPNYLDLMEGRGYDPFRTRIELSPWRKPLILWRAARHFRSH